MTPVRRALVVFAPLFLAALIVPYWVRAGGSSGLAGRLAQADPLIVASMISVTGFWVIVRFVRWQFLLRRTGVRVPIRLSFAVYLAGLPGTATPAYLGELVRNAFLYRRFRADMRATTWVWLVERGYDLAALGIVLMSARLVSGHATLLVPGLVLVVTTAVLLVLWPVGRWIGIDPALLRWQRTPSTVAATLALSLAAWGPAAWLMGLAGDALAVPISWTAGAEVFTFATVVGAATLLPAGIGATGSTAIVEVVRTGVSVADAVAVVTLVRITSTYTAIGVGTLFLVGEVRAWRRSRAAAPSHFDSIASEYNRQWSPHVWDHLLKRKLDLMAAAIGHADRRLGLDLGCGLGVQTAAMAERGYHVVGVEPAIGLLQAGQRATGSVLAGDARALPFADASFDFAYAIGVLHHLPGRHAQADAYREVARVLKPGGVFLVHETNPRNPLFRFYMGYLFPMLKSIDEGTESWVEAEQPDAPPTLALESITYFTFLPDFTPRAFMTLARAVETWLEQGRSRRYSAHYMAIMRRR